MKSFTGKAYLQTGKINILSDAKIYFLARYTFGHLHQWKAWFPSSSLFLLQLHLLNLELHLFNFVMPLEILLKLMQKMHQRNPNNLAQTNLFHKIHSRKHSYAFYALFSTCSFLVDLAQCRPWDYGVNHEIHIVWIICMIHLFPQVSKCLQSLNSTSRFYIIIWITENWQVFIFQ